MARSDSKTVAVCDAGPIIHLEELDSLDIISDFHEVIIPKAVQLEISKHKPGAFSHTEVDFKVANINFPPDPRLITLSNALSLDKGELESLSLLSDHHDAIFLTDDAAARLAGEMLGYKVHGTIGIILRAIRRKIKTPKEVVELLNGIKKKTTLFIKPELLNGIIQKIKFDYSVK